MFSDDLLALATNLLADLRQRRMLIATAESCTGGLIVALLTEIPGSSDLVDRGFVTYSNDAKTRMLGVRPELISAHGAVSRDVTEAMAAGAIANSSADVAVAVTGMAGPGGGSAGKPIGLVHIATALADGRSQHRECRFGDIGRSGIRLATVREALELARAAVAG